MPNISRQLGIRIYKLRHQRGITQQKLSELTGLTVHYIQKIESKKPQNPSLDTLVRIARALKVDVWRLLKF